MTATTSRSVADARAEYLTESTEFSLQSRPPMSLGSGSRLDAYELLHPIGAGGMGEVWLATEVRLGRKVALKLLPAELPRDSARVSRFEQEARAASALSHPNVCTIHALGETAEGSTTSRWSTSRGRP